MSFTVIFCTLWRGYEAPKLDLSDGMANVAHIMLHTVSVKLVDLMQTDSGDGR